MIHIPSDEIKQPNIHADTLGSTFVWNGHFLRGIYHDSVCLARSYFSSGFIDEIVSKGYFPNTWISEFENEQFALIIEHEKISPILYATEWNSAMLKDAALLVLEIAEIGLKYRYNMVDCHKLNVMFCNNRPLYVDLGSFVPQESGTTGWSPYTSFLHSYYYILKMWTCGGEVLAKRMMAPGIELSDKDYFSWKSPFYRIFPIAITLNAKIRDGLCRLAVWDYETVARKGGFGAKIAKKAVDRFRLSRSQRLYFLKRSVKKIKISKVECQKADDWRISELLSVVGQNCMNYKSVTLINLNKSGYLDKILESSGNIRVISINESEYVSNTEYLCNKTVSLCSTHFRLLNNTVLIRNKFPEKRLKSDVVIIPELDINKISKNFGVHNASIFVKHCSSYAQEKLVVYTKTELERLSDILAQTFKIKSIHSTHEGGYIIIDIYG